MMFRRSISSSWSSRSNKNSNTYKNLSNNESGRCVNTSGLLDALLRIAHMDLNDQADKYAGVVLMDLANAPSNQITTTQNERLLGRLVKMVLIEKNTRTHELAITVLQNLAFIKESRIWLVSFKRRIVLEALIRVLSSRGNDSNKKLRRRAAGALTNLACDESVELMG